MRLFGFEITRSKAAVSALGVRDVWGTVLEPFAGAWQRNITAESRKNLLAFSALFTCISLIAEDIAKLRLRLMQFESPIWREVDTVNPFQPVLDRPNRFQTRQQFFIHWLVSKLMWGNAYTFKSRDARRVVRELYPLDPRHVTPKVSTSGEVFYDLGQHELANIGGGLTVPASEIIHDRGITPWHPLVGVSPIYACGSSATQGIRIQANSEAFFGNMSRPSGQLTSPTTISDSTAARLKEQFEQNFRAGNIGRLLVTGDGLKYEPMTIPAADAQLIEQLKWTVEDVARAYRVPLHKLAAGAPPSFNNIGALNQDYYAHTLQPHIEAIEALLDDGLGLGNVEGKRYGCEFDLAGLLRMDPLTRADTHSKLVGAGVLAPDEARREWDLPAVEGGGTPYLQQQNYSLAALAKRDAQADPFGTEKPATASPTLPPTPDEDELPEDDDMAKSVADELGPLLESISMAQATATRKYVDEVLAAVVTERDLEADKLACTKLVSEAVTKKFDVEAAAYA